MPSIQQGWSTASDTDRWVAQRRMPIASRGPEAARGGRVDEEAAEPSGLRAAGGGRSNSNDGFLHVGRLVASTSDADRWATCPQRRIPIAGLRDVGYRAPRMYLRRCAAGAVTRVRQDPAGCGPGVEGDRGGEDSFHVSGGSWSQCRVPSARLQAVGCRSTRTVVSSCLGC